MTLGTTLSTGSKVLVKDNGKQGVITSEFPESTYKVFDVLLDGEAWPTGFDADELTLLPPVSAEIEVGKHDTSKSFHLFEVLLDAAEEAHPGSKSFYNELINCGLLHSQKQRDYGKPEDPFANVRSTEEWGIAGWVGAMVRLNDKVKRLQTLARTGGLANESAIDSFRDIAVYSLIALVLYQQESSATA